MTALTTYKKSCQPLGKYFIIASPCLSHIEGHICIQSPRWAQHWIISHVMWRNLCKS